MRRKIVLQGGVALTVSLPSKWTKKNNIQKGDEIELIENGNTLMLCSNNSKENENEILSENISYGSGTFGVEIAKLYEKGYNYVHVEFSKPSNLREIEECISDMIGFTIVKQDKKGCLIKCISKTEKKEFKNMFRRNFMVTLMIADETGHWNKKTQKESAAQLRSLHKMLKKTSLYCRRYLLQSGDPLAAPYYSLTRDLERISNEYFSIHNTILRRNIAINGKSRYLFSETKKFLKRFYNIHYGIEKGENRLSEEIKQVLTEKKWLHLTDIEESRVVHSLGNIMKILGESSILAYPTNSRAN